MNNMEKIMSSKRSAFLSRMRPISQMTAQQLESWKNIAKLENRPVYLVNGLDIYPDGLYAIDCKVSAIYDAKYESEKLLIKLCETKSQNSEI
jgi:hypothetical protein